MPKRNKNTFIIYFVFETNSETKKDILNLIDKRIKSNENYNKETLPEIWQDFDTIKSNKNQLFGAQKGLVQYIYQEKDTGIIHLKGFILDNKDLNNVQARVTHYSSKRTIEEELLFTEYGKSNGNLALVSYVVGMISIAYAYICEEEYDIAKQTLDEVKNRLKSERKGKNQIDEKLMNTFISLYYDVVLKKYNFFSPTTDFKVLLKEIEIVKRTIKDELKQDIPRVEIAEMRIEFIINQGNTGFCNESIKKIYQLLAENRTTDPQNHERYLVLKLNQIFLYHWLDKKDAYNNAITDLKNQQENLTCFKRIDQKEYFNAVVESHIAQINIKNSFSEIEVEKAQAWKKEYVEIIKDIN